MFYVLIDDILKIGTSFAGHVTECGNILKGETHEFCMLHTLYSTLRIHGNLTTDDTDINLFTLLINTLTPNF